MPPSAVGSFDTTRPALATSSSSALSSDNSDSSSSSSKQQAGRQWCVYVVAGRQQCHARAPACLIITLCIARTSGTLHSLASSSSLKPFCMAPAETGSRGLPDSVYPSPDSATLAGSTLPRRHSLMKWRCAWLLTASASLVASSSAHAWASKQRRARHRRLLQQRQGLS